MSRTHPMPGLSRGSSRRNPTMENKADSHDTIEEGESSIEIQVEPLQTSQPIALEYLNLQQQQQHPYPYQFNAESSYFTNSNASMFNKTPPNPARISHYGLATTDIGQSAATLTIDEKKGLSKTFQKQKLLQPRPKWEVAPEYLIYNNYHGRTYCCCFKTRKGCCTTICCFLFIFLIFVGVGGYFMYPRIPDIRIGFPYVPNNTTAALSIAPNGTLTRIDIDVLVNFTISSTNNWDYYISTIDATGNLIDIDNNPIPNAFGTGNMTQITVPANSNQTYTIPLRVSWTSIGLGATRDRALVTLTNCTLATPPQTFKADYHIVATLPLVSWTGYTMKVSGFFTFNILALPRSARNEILKLVNQILQSVQK